MININDLKNIPNNVKEYRDRCFLTIITHAFSTIVFPDFSNDKIWIRKDNTFRFVYEDLFTAISFKNNTLALVGSGGHTEDLNFKNRTLFNNAPKNILKLVTKASTHLPDWLESTSSPKVNLGCWAIDNKFNYVSFTGVFMPEEDNLKQLFFTPWSEHENYLKEMHDFTSEDIELALNLCVKRVNTWGEKDDWVKKIFLTKEEETFLHEKAVSEEAFKEGLEHLKDLGIYLK